MDDFCLQAAIYAGHVAETLRRLEAAQSVAERRHLLDGLRRVVAAADPGSVSESTLERLGAVGFDRQELAHLRSEIPDAAVHVPLVALGRGSDEAGHEAGYEVAHVSVDVGCEGEPTGFCRLMIASYDPAHTHVLRERYDAAARAAVADGFHAAAQALGHVPLESFAFVPYRRGVLAQVAISGASLGAATAVSAASIRSCRPVRAGTAVTGRILGERVVTVGGLEEKLAALVGREDIRRLIVASDDRPVAAALAAHHDLKLEVIGVAQVGELLEAALEPDVRAERDPERAVDEVQTAYARGWQGWQWPALLERLSRLALQVPARRPDLQVRVLTMLGAVHRNLGNPGDAFDMLEEAFGVLADDEANAFVPDDVRTFLYRHRAVTLRLLCRFDEALEAAQEAERSARRGRLRGDLAFALGTRGLVHVSRGELDEAIACQQRALEHLLHHDPRHATRAAANLIQAQGLAGKVEEARGSYRRGLRLLEGANDGDRRRTDEQWLRVRMAGAVRDPAHAAEVHDLLGAPLVQATVSHQPLPGLLVRRWAALAQIELADRASAEARRKAYAQLAQSATAYAVAHPTVQEPHVRFLAQLNVLYEARARAMHDELDADAVQRARLALTYLPATPEAAALLSPAAAPVLEALAEDPPPRARLVAALDVLLRACGSLE